MFAVLGRVSVVSATQSVRVRSSALAHSYSYSWRKAAFSTQPSSSFLAGIRSTIAELGRRQAHFDSKMAGEIICKAAVAWEPNKPLKVEQIRV